MGILDFIFGKDPDAGIPLEQIPEVAAYLERVNCAGHTATHLNPERAISPLPTNVSKIGGAPYAGIHSDWPKCESCNSSMYFLLQLFRRDFPEFPFYDHDLFQIFRCPNEKCPLAYGDHSDRALRLFFGDEQQASQQSISCPVILDALEQKPRECILSPQKVVELPSEQDQDVHTLGLLDAIRKRNKRLINRLDLLCPPNARCGTKIGGYPDWIQEPNYPTCSCGKRKELFFQFNDDDSLHGIMIGDSGNIYFFHCKDCGVKSIETNYDCC